MLGGGGGGGVVPPLPTRLHRTLSVPPLAYSVIVISFGVLTAVGTVNEHGEPVPI